MVKIPFFLLLSAVALLALPISFAPSSLVECYFVAPAPGWEVSDVTFFPKIVSSSEILKTRSLVHDGISIEPRERIFNFMKPGSSLLTYERQSSETRFHSVEFAIPLRAKPGEHTLGATLETVNGVCTASTRYHSQDHRFTDSSLFAKAEKAPDFKPRDPLPQTQSTSCLYPLVFVVPYFYDQNAGNLSAAEKYASAQSLLATVKQRYQTMLASQGYAGPIDMVEKAPVVYLSQPLPSSLPGFNVDGFAPFYNNQNFQASDYNGVAIEYGSPAVANLLSTLKQTYPSVELVLLIDALVDSAGNLDQNVAAYTNLDYGFVVFPLSPDFVGPYANIQNFVVVDTDTSNSGFLPEILGHEIAHSTNQGHGYPPPNLMTVPYTDSSFFLTPEQACLMKARFVSTTGNSFYCVTGSMSGTYMQAMVPVWFGTSNFFAKAPSPYPYTQELVCGNTMLDVGERCEYGYFADLTSTIQPNDGGAFFGDCSMDPPSVDPPCVQQGTCQPNFWTGGAHDPVLALWNIPTTPNCYTTTISGANCVLQTPFGNGIYEPTLEGCEFPVNCKTNANMITPSCDSGLCYEHCDNNVVEPQYGEQCEDFAGIPYGCPTLWGFTCKKCQCKPLPKGPSVSGAAVVDGNPIIEDPPPKKKPCVKTAPGCGGTCKDPNDICVKAAKLDGFGITMCTCISKEKLGPSIPTINSTHEDPGGIFQWKLL